MSDQTPDPTAWSDDQLDDLLDALTERAAERDDLDLPGSGPTRRTVLATLLGAGGLGLGATQLGAAASWGSASGTLGTQSSPIDQANVRDLDAKVLETEQIQPTETGGQTTRYVSFNSGSLLQQETQSVGTTATVILDPDTVSTAFVAGRDGGDIFLDRVGIIGNTQSNTNLQILNSPAARTYTVNNGKLSLEMGSSSYDIHVNAFDSL